MLSFIISHHYRVNDDENDYDNDYNADAGVIMKIMIEVTTMSQHLFSFKFTFAILNTFNINYNDKLLNLLVLSFF